MDLGGGGGGQFGIQRGSSPTVPPAPLPLYQYSHSLALLTQRRPLLKVIMQREGLPPPPPSQYFLQSTTAVVAVLYFISELL